jgi:hypothetical protein
VLWDVATGSAICGSPNPSDFVLCCEFFHHNPDKLVTAGNYNLTIWTYDQANNKLLREEAHLGNMQRMVRSIQIDAEDRFVYCGTTTGDVLQVSLLSMSSSFAAVSQQSEHNSCIIFENLLHIVSSAFHFCC